VCAAGAPPGAASCALRPRADEGGRSRAPSPGPRARRWTDNVTLHAIGRLTGLEALDLAESDSLDDAGLLPLRGLPALRALSLARCRWVGDSGCRALAQVGSGAALGEAARLPGGGGLRAPS
jgi:hypothetical protein